MLRTALQSREESRKPPRCSPGDKASLPVKSRTQAFPGRALLEREVLLWREVMDPFDSKSGMFHVLRALEGALGYTRAAILAAHPELREERPLCQRPLKLDATGWAADEILTHLSG